ncbi:nucleotidyl transferase AbiEii/AbiGii toxin family protein [Streptomyces sp. NPDC000594]|uniref:nucleotidyl transferase AbiEii/AbiGii toxin family protein n=1 Tax=Streptomyces sp. NPDC000594 TaxID=3154261 RepID=UPI003320B577
MTPGRRTETGAAGLTTRDRQSLRAVGAVLHSLVRLLPPGGWHLKGSAALLGWTGPAARLPEDVDLSLPVGAGPLLLGAAALPSGPGGERIRLLRTEPVVFGAPDRPPVHRALVQVTGRGLAERLLLNVLLVPDARAARDTRTAPLDFPYDGGTGTVAVPAATFGRCLAQKLLRYTRRRENGKVNTRWSDLLDFLLAADCTTAPPLLLAELAREVAAEFAPMGRAWPGSLPPPPAEWLDFWDTAVFRTGLPYGTLPDAATRLAPFWTPVLAHPVPPYGPLPGSTPDRRWSPASWRWERTD